MKKIIFIIAILSLTSCKKDVQIPDEVQPYVDSFYMDAKARGVYTYKLKGVVFYDTLARGAAGTEKRGYIMICELCWEWQTPWKRKPLIYHELAHALIGRGDQDVPWKSIMNELPFDYYQNEQYYIDELFYKKP